MGDVMQLLLCGFALMVVIYNRSLRALLHQFRVLARAMKKEFAQDTPPPAKVRPERQPENIS